MKLDSTGSVAVTHEWKMQPVPKDPLQRSELVGVELLLRGQGGCTVKSVFRECDAAFWTHYSPLPSAGGVAVPPEKPPTPLTSQELRDVLEHAKADAGVKGDASSWVTLDRLLRNDVAAAVCRHIANSLNTLHLNHD